MTFCAAIAMQEAGRYEHTAAAVDKPTSKLDVCRSFRPSSPCPSPDYDDGIAAEDKHDTAEALTGFTKKLGGRRDNEDEPSCRLLAIGDSPGAS